MTGVELDVADSFERVFPLPTVVADWDDVLDRAEVRHRPRTLPLRSWRVAAAATAILVGGLLVTPAFGLGGRLLELIQGKSALRQVQTPVWSSDGRRIAFISIRDGNPEIYVMNADGSEQRNLTQSPLRDGGPAWSPNGRTIAFERWLERNPEVFVMNVDGSGQRNLTRDPEADVYPDWSPDGRKVAFVRRIGFLGQPPPNGAPPGRPTLFRNFLYVVNADGSGLRRLTQDPVYGFGATLAPAWSSDGRTIRFGPSVVRADGSGQRRVPRYIPYAAGAWSPDGRKIAFAHGFRRGTPFMKFELRVMNADGSGLRRLARNVTSNAPVWSTDGRRIAFRSVRDGNPEIYVMNADGSELRRLTDNPANERWFSWSPDGKRLAFVRNQEVHLVNADGSGEQQLTLTAS